MQRLVAILLVGLGFSGVAAGDVADWLSNAALPREITAAEVSDFLISRVPEFEVPPTAEAWQARARALRERFLADIVFQGVPDSWKAPETRVEWGETLDQGAYRIRKLRYEAVPGFWIPAILYEPSGVAGNIPAILNVNGHSAHGKAHVDEQTRCINLALRGMLALHPEWLSFGELNDPGNAHGNLAYLDLVGTRGLSVFYLAIKRGIDVLATHPRTDPDRIAMTGLSGGGWQTTVLSALDERIGLIVPNAGHGPFVARIHTMSDIGDLEQAPSDMMTVGGYTHLTALFAPRPALLIYNARDNCCFLPDHTLPPLLDAARPIYELLGAAPLLESYVNEDPGTHNYELDNRQQFYRFVNKHFLSPDQRVDDEIPCADDIKTAEELTVGIPENNETFVSLARSILHAIARPAIPDPADAGFREWQSVRRQRLIEVTKPVEMEFRAGVVSTASENGISATTYILRSDGWTIPAVYFVPDGAEGATTLVIADAGMASEADAIRELLDARRQVVAIDPTFIGSTQPAESASERLAMLVNTTGERLLGIHAGQIAAACAWVRDRLSLDDVTIQTRGTSMGLAALVALGIAPNGVDRIRLFEMPESLEELIVDLVPYTRMPSVFCFGLLKVVDVPDLEALCHPVEVAREG